MFAGNNFLELFGHNFSMKMSNMAHLYSRGNLHYSHWVSDARGTHIFVNLFSLLVFCIALSNPHKAHQIPKLNFSCSCLPSSVKPGVDNEYILEWSTRLLPTKSSSSRLDKWAASARSTCQCSRHATDCNAVEGAPNCEGSIWWYCKNTKSRVEGMPHRKVFHTCCLCGTSAYTSINLKDSWYLAQRGV